MCVCEVSVRGCGNKVHRSFTVKLAISIITFYYYVIYTYYSIAYIYFTSFSHKPQLNLHFQLIFTPRFS